MESRAIEDHRLLIGVRLQPLRTARPERPSYHVKLSNVTASTHCFAALLRNCKKLIVITQR